MLTWPRSPAPDEDPSVAAVEQILGAAAFRESGEVPSGDERPVATYALWICACDTVDDAPTWLIYDEGDDGFVWRRVPDPVEPMDLIEARFHTGGHTDPEWVLRWLQGVETNPWTTPQGQGGVVVLDELRRRIRSE